MILSACALLHRLTSFFFHSLFKAHYLLLEWLDNYAGEKKYVSIILKLFNFGQPASHPQLC